MGINLLQDREIIEENNKKKKSSRNFDMTNPAVQKDETREKIKKEGVIEFFKHIFKQPPKIKIQSEEEIIQDAPEIKKYPRHETKKAKMRNHLDRMARTEEPIQVKRQEPLVQKSVPIPKPRFELRRRDSRISPSTPWLSRATRPSSGKEKPQANELAEGAPKTYSDSSLNVNLIPEEIRTKLEPKRKLKVLILAVAICVGVILLIWGVMIWEQSRIQKNIQDVIAQSTQVEQEIASYESVRKTGEQLNSKISQAQAVLDSHVYWTKFLAELENYTLPNVYYQNMAASLNGTVTLSAQAPDLPTLAKQYQVMQNATEFIKTVAITAAAISTEGDNQKVTFNITLTVDPAVFYQQSNESTK